MLTWLCAGRFGLGWAHDAFYFARHILMHFHAYVLYFQYTCHIWNFLVLFWLSPSFPLSLLFTLVVSMAPKHKSAPSRNPLCSGASSSSDPTSSSIRFRDEDTQKDFWENVSRQGVHLECQVILLDFSDTDLPTVTHSQGWESLCDVPVICPSMLI